MGTRSRCTELASESGESMRSSRLKFASTKRNRIALPPQQRVIIELGEIEDDAMLARGKINAPPREPASLIAARTAQADSGPRVWASETRLAEARATTQQLQQRRPWWRRAVGVFSGENARRAAGVRASTLS